ncbi:MAG: YtxH domain-containing protein [Paludibacteraceae bacterium]|nr:YtxH domain-containing protein [Paludibacteraceae bacterium]MBR4839687.1 YtxH domain-containing protein [Paludibacteraceae bacterium]
MGKNGFFGGILVGAALALAGAHFLKTEKGKETREKAKKAVDKLRDELLSKIERGTSEPESNE